MCFAEWDLSLTINSYRPSTAKTYPFANEIVSKVCGKYVHRQSLTHCFAMNLLYIIDDEMQARNEDLTSNVAITPSAILKDADTLSTVSNKGSLSS